MSYNRPLPIPKMVVSHINHETIMQEVMTTHDPDSKDFPASFIFNFVKNILYPITSIGKAIPEYEKLDEEFDEEIFEDKGFNEEPKDVELLYHIKRLSFEMALKGWDHADQHSTIINFLKMLSIYSWKAKLLMMLAAFSINFGEFILVNSHKGLASKLATLKGSTSPVAPSHIHESITHFIKSILHLTKCIVELAKSSSYCSSPIIPVSCYWIITSILTYASYFARFSSVNSGWLIAEGTQLSNLTAKVKDLIFDCRPILEKKREEESYNALCCAFLEENPTPSTNLDILKLLFNIKDCDKKKPIYDGYRYEMVDLCSLKNKSLLLLISSSLDIDNYLLLILRDLQWGTKLRVLWIPILDGPALWTTKNIKKHYRGLVNKGLLLSMRNLQKSVAPGLVKFVKEKFFPTFQIGGEPIIVSLDHHGRIAHRNAMHMILIRALDIFYRISTRGSSGDSIIPLLQNVLKERTLPVREFVPDIDRKISDFVGEINRKMNDWLLGIHEHVEDPIYSNIYTRKRENDLWKEVTWCTKLLSTSQSGLLSNWADENKYIFIIGGNDIKWVKKFTSKVLYANPQLVIGMCYLGTNINVASMIIQDNICETFSTESLLFFWARLQSMFLSRIQFLNEAHRDEESDEIVEGLKKLLAYEANESAVEGWVLLSKANKIIICDLGDKMLTVMNEYDKWKEDAIAKGFDQAFKDHHEMLASTSTSHHHPYCALKYPSNFNKIPENLKCPQCCRNMHKFVNFTCCHGHGSKFDDYNDAY